MPLTFSETMQGTLHDASGGEHDVSFTVTAIAEGGGYFRLHGVASASPWAGARGEGKSDGAPATGVLVLSPRFLRYRVRFAGPGGMWTVAGQKLPSLRSPVRSMTVLPVTLVDAAGVEQARGDLRFDLKELPAFALSWIPRPRRSAAAHPPGEPAT